MKLFDFFALRLLSNKDLDLIDGKNLFTGFMPASCKDGFLVVVNQPLYLNFYSKLAEGSVQVIYRSGSPVKSYDMALKASEILTGFNFGTLKEDGVRVIKSIPRSMPLIYPKGETGLYEASVNLTVTCALTNN